jgi:hypothetical protein
VRQQLRERAGTTVSGLATTGTRVYQGRVYPLAQAQLPCLLVYTNSEEVEHATLTPPRKQFRRLELVIEGKARGDNLEDTLDTIAKEVEAALYADRTLNSLARDSVLKSSDIDLSSQGDQPHGSVRLTYEVFYQTAEGTPDSAG